MLFIAARTQPLGPAVRVAGFRQNREQACISVEELGAGVYQIRPCPSEIGVLLPDNQRQHRTLHIQKDVLPYALC